jgi:hypothetical protein
MKTTKNPAAVALGKLSRINPTPAQNAASAANGKKGGRPPKHQTIAMIFRRAEGDWKLAHWKGDNIGRQPLFRTVADAKAYAKEHGWGAKRLPECDA